MTAAAEKKVHLRVITPDKIKLNEKVDMVIMRCTTGDMGVLPNHTACSMILDYGVLRVMKPDGVRKMAVYGGIAQMKDNVLTLLANAAQWPNEINRENARSDYDAAEERLKDKQSLKPEDVLNSQKALKRAKVQLELNPEG